MVMLGRTKVCNVTPHKATAIIYIHRFTEYLNLNSAIKA